MKTLSFIASNLFLSFFQAYRCHSEHIMENSSVLLPFEPYKLHDILCHIDVKWFTEGNSLRFGKVAGNRNEMQDHFSKFPSPHVLCVEMRKWFRCLCHKISSESDDFVCVRVCVCVKQIVIYQVDWLPHPLLSCSQFFLLPYFNPQCPLPFLTRRQMNFFINWQKFWACEHFINAFSNPYLGEYPEKPSPSSLPPQFAISLLPRPSSRAFSMTPVVVITFNFQLSFVSTFALVLLRGQNWLSQSCSSSCQWPLLLFVSLSAPLPPALPTLSPAARFSSFLAALYARDI